MATINKPGVYIQEFLTPNAPSVGITGPSVAAFIGVADRGPTGTSASPNVIAVPTVVNNLSEFTNIFGYGSAAGIYDSSVTSTAANPNTVGSTSTVLKDAVKTFFDNGGTQAVIMRVVNKNANPATTTFIDQSGSVSIAASTSNVTITAGAGNITFALPAGVAPFADAQPGTLVSFSGITAATNSGALLNTTASFVIDSIVGTGTGIVLRAPSGTSSTATVISSGTVVVTGGIFKATSTAPTATGVTVTLPGSNALQVSAINPGVWGKNLWVAVTPNVNANYFDLTVYYSTRAAIAAVGGVSSALLDSEIVEQFQGLSLNASDTNKFAPNAVSSNWITVAVGGTTTSATRIPAFTKAWTSAASGSNGQFTWNTYNTTLLPFDTTDTNEVAVRLGVSTNTDISVGSSSGSEGSTAPALSTDILNKFDAIQSPLVVNYPGVIDATSVGNVLDYVSTRGDSFAIIDPGTAATTVANVISNLGGYQSTGLNYAGVYFPNLVIQDPASSITTATKVVAPGGAVAALFTSTDATRGSFKSPAGIASPFGYAYPQYTLSNDDFTKVNGAPRYVNIIRTVPGSGTCVMGSRTIYSNYSDKYIAVRRALNFLEWELKNNTQYAIFEPNDQNLWTDITGICTGTLNDYWRAGGLAGETSDQAYYVKCDSTNNTPTTIAAGQLNIEVGVALQRPAEFIIIKVSQFNGGSTVTSSI